MIITTDEKLIRSIIEDDTVIGGFSGGNRIEDVDIGVYFYEPGVGLFPARISGNSISMHAAIPKKNRGVKAVNAAKYLAEVLSLKYDVYAQVRLNVRHFKRFVRMVGFTHLHDSDKYHIYRYLK